MKKALIISAVRTPVGRAIKGTLKHTRPDELAALVMREAVARAKGLDPERVEDVVFGCAMPEAEQGLNVARVASLRAGLPHTAGGVTVNRFCASGLEAIAIASARVALGQADVVIAGGVESMSLIPMGGNKVSPDLALATDYPEAYINMGNTAERVARRFEIPREAQDEFSAASHRRAARAIAEGVFEPEIVPVPVVDKFINSKNKVESREILFDRDECVRPDTTVETLATLRPAFRVDGSVTAGNSSPLSDGASAVVVVSEDVARELGADVMGHLVAYAATGVDPDIMGVGPIFAVPKALSQAGLTMDDIDFVELNEAFASQSVYVKSQLHIPDERLNVNGGAIALGHPLGCTGSKLTTSLLYHLGRTGGTHGVVTMCVGGGMGAAGVFRAGS